LSPLIVIQYVLYLEIQRGESADQRFNLKRQFFLPCVVMFYTTFLTAHLILFANDRHESEKFIDKINGEVPIGSKIFQVDGSGFTGYFSDSPVINGDGLVNSLEYARLMLDSGLDYYLDTNGIDYIITNTIYSGKAPLVFRNSLLTSHDYRYILGVENYTRSPFSKFSLYKLERREFDRYDEPK
jgi:hypothetical protein